MRSSPWSQRPQWPSSGSKKLLVTVKQQKSYGQEAVLRCPGANRREGWLRRAHRVQCVRRTMPAGQAPAPRQRAGTYRVQLHAGFGFDDAAAVTGYLARLGVSHLYCSPSCRPSRAACTATTWSTTAGSTPSLAGRGICPARRAAGRGRPRQVLDIVPNHMAVAGRASAWWWDVLENGPSSRFADYFDIDWDPPRPSWPAGCSWRCSATTTAGCSTRASSPSSGAGNPCPSAITSMRRRCRAAPSTGWTATTKACSRIGGRRRLNTDPDALDGCCAGRTTGWPTGAPPGRSSTTGGSSTSTTLAGLRVEDQQVFADTHRLILDLVARRRRRRPPGRPRRRAARPGGLPPAAARRDRRRLYGGREDPRGRRGAARRLAGGRHHRLRLPEPGQPPVRRPGRRERDAGTLRPLHRRDAGLRRDRARRQAPGHARGAGRRDGPADRPAGPRSATATAATATTPGGSCARRCGRCSPAFPVYRTYAAAGRGRSAADDAGHVAAAVAGARQRRPELDAELLDSSATCSLGEHPGAAEADSPCASPS